jgi:hypothetical protein
MSDNDLIRLACERAVDLFDCGNGVFNSAGFSRAFTRMSGTSQQLDGNVVRTMLAGRPDVEVLSGSSHFKLIVEPTN